MVRTTSKTGQQSSSIDNEGCVRPVEVSRERHILPCTQRDSHTHTHAQTATETVKRETETATETATDIMNWTHCKHHDRDILSCEIAAGTWNRVFEHSAGRLALTRHLMEYVHGNHAVYLQPKPPPDTKSSHFSFVRILASRCLCMTGTHHVMNHPRHPFIKVEWDGAFEEGANIYRRCGWSNP